MNSNNTLDVPVKRRIYKSIKNLSQIPSQYQEPYIKNHQSENVLKGSFGKPNLNHTKTEKKLTHGRILNLFQKHKIQVEKKIISGIFSKEYDLNKKIYSSKEIESPYVHQIFGPKMHINSSNQPEILKNRTYDGGKTIFTTPTNFRGGVNTLNDIQFLYTAKSSEQNFPKYSGKIIKINKNKNQRPSDELEDFDCNIDEEEDKEHIRGLPFTSNICSNKKGLINMRLNKNSNNLFFYFLEILDFKIVKIFVSYFDIISIYNFINIARRIYAPKYKKLLKDQLKELISNNLDKEKRKIYWKLAASIQYKMRKFGNYFSLIIRNEAKVEIFHDIERTFPFVEYFNKGKEGYKKLLNVLNGLAYHFPQIGYCQGMNFYCAVILLFLENIEESFWMAEYIMQLWNRKLMECMNPNLSRLKLVLFQVDCFVYYYYPKLHEYFKSSGIRADFYASQWLLTLFTYDMSFDFSSKVIDLYLVCGWKILVKIILALVAFIKDDLENLNPESVMTILKTFTRKKIINKEKIFESVNKFKVTNRNLFLLEDLFLKSKVTEPSILTNKCINKNKSNLPTPKVKLTTTQYITLNKELKFSFQNLFPLQNENKK